MTLFFPLSLHLQIKTKLIMRRSFGEQKEGIAYKVLDERTMRGSAGIMLLLAAIAFINGFILQNYIAISYISGFLALNFSIGLLINPQYTPTVLFAKSMVKDQKPLYIGAIQKQFAWGMGLVLSLSIFILSLLLLWNPAYFNIVCMLCVICLSVLYLETAFGICAGCSLYHQFIQWKWIKPPKEKPNCMGDSCGIG